MTKLSSIGEKLLVKTITNGLTVDKRLIGGFGHDSAILDLGLKSDELLLFNTDRSGMNVAYKMGLADGKCVGDFGISHAVSDILASGGTPLVASVALLLPDASTVEFVEQVMQGAELAAKKYGAFIAAGDTKHNSKFAMVVSVIGKCNKDQALTRATAQPSDFLVAIGNFGLMLSGYIAFNEKLHISEESRQIFAHALTYQNPPYTLARQISEHRLSHACIDNSDGLSSSLYSLCEASGVGIIVEKNDIPISTHVANVAHQINVDPFQLCLGSGDWQHIHAIPEQNIQALLQLADQCNVPATVIGRFTETKQVGIHTDSGVYELARLENDRFGINGIKWFDLLSHKVDFLGTKLNV